MPTFDGDNLLIILDSGVNVVDVKVDLYSDWKEWVKTADNTKYPLAFRTIAGDPKGSITAAPTYFLQNQNGWRIRPPEENITISLVGDLQLEDTTLPGIVPTIGAFTTMVLGAVESIIGVDAFSTTLNVVENLTRNKRVLNRSTGVETVYAADGTTVLFTRNVYEDEGGATPYDGDAAPHRVERYT